MTKLVPKPGDEKWPHRIFLSVAVWKTGQGELLMRLILGSASWLCHMLSYIRREIRFLKPNMMDLAPTGGKGFKWNAVMKRVLFTEELLLLQVTDEKHDVKNITKLLQINILGGTDIVWPGWVTLIFLISVTVFESIWLSEQSGPM